MLPSSPQGQGRELAETPIKKLRLGPTSLEGFITRTPLRPPALALKEVCTPEAEPELLPMIRVEEEAGGGKQKSTSIYAQLGWDDDFDDLA